MVDQTKSIQNLSTERGHSETQFRNKKHQKKLSKTRDIQIRNSDRITKLALRKLARTQKM